MSLLPEVREMTPLGREAVSQIPEKCCLFPSNHQKSYSPGEPVSGYLDCLGGMEFALDLTEKVPPCQLAQRGRKLE